MATKIGSNFEYKGPLFLDARQGEPKTKADLKNWSILVPEGFKVCIDKLWYIYDSSKPLDPETGKFHPIFDSVLGDSTNTTLSQRALGEKFEEVNEAIANIEGSVWPLEFKTFSGGGHYHQGQTITPSMSWVIQRQGKDIPTLSEVTVNGSKEGLSPDLKLYTSPSTIAANKTYTVVVKVGRLQVTKSCDYVFGFKRYFGTSSLAKLNSGDIQNLSLSDWNTGTKLSTTKFDCTGGKYPWFCFPSSAYTSVPEIWVGGLQVSDIVTSKVQLTNGYGQKTEYTCLRLGSKQTGNIPIELK